MANVETRTEHAVATTNACKLCTPLGAALAFKGIEGAVPFLHGSQGCATYMRRYVISHFREPVDIASSALGEKNAVFGGAPNLKKGLLNVMKKYGPQLIGVASTCLTETIGDDLRMILTEFRREFGDLDLPEIVHVSTPSYAGTHTDGYTRAVAATVAQVCREQAPASDAVNILPPLVSCADLRHLKELARAFGLEPILLPDHSDTLEGPALLDYERIPSGGTKLSAIQAMSGARGSLQLGRCIGPVNAGDDLAARFGVPVRRLGLPMGLRESDALLDALSELSGRPIPRELDLARGRLVDSYVDGHKYLFGKRAVVFGDEDIVVGLCSFLSEIGIQVVLAASGSSGRGMAGAVRAVCAETSRELPEVREGADFHDIAEEAGRMAPDLLVGHSKGYRYARQWNIPLVRVGFPVHDRFGAQRIVTLGHEGAQVLYDRLVNAVLDHQQSASPVGYTYL
ncbi:MAG: nitrogenase component 1 [Desulfovibrionaceae bacterium]